MKARPQRGGDSGGVTMAKWRDCKLGDLVEIKHGFAFLGEHFVQIRDRKQADQHFIYYLFNSKRVRQQIRASASGTKIRHTAPSRIADVKVSAPPLPVQRRIAGILSVYDELRENSQRRIWLYGLSRSSTINRKPSTTFAAQPK